MADSRAKVDIRAKQRQTSWCCHSDGHNASTTGKIDTMSSDVLLASLLSSIRPSTAFT